MIDRIFNGFLERQVEEGLALAKASDLFDLAPMPAPDGQPPDHHIMDFRCRGMVRRRDGRLVQAGRFTVGVFFPPDYLRQADMFRVLTLLGPPETFAPNVRFPMLCVGRLGPGTGIVDLAYQVYEILTYQRFSSHDGLNQAACQWARNPANRGRFPLDSRPLKRPVPEQTMETATA